MTNRLRTEEELETIGKDALAGWYVTKPTPIVPPSVIVDLLHDVRVLARHAEAMAQAADELVDMRNPLYFEPLKDAVAAYRRDVPKEE